MLTSTGQRLSLQSPPYTKGIKKYGGEMWGIVIVGGNKGVSKC